MTCDGGASDPRFVGDPIDVVTGAFVEDTKDFQIADPAPIVWRRLYSSRDIAADRGLGVGHTHSFDHQLKIHLDGIGYTAPSGTNVEFPAFTDVSVRVATRGYVLRRRDRELIVETPDGLTIVFEMGAVALARPVRVGDVRLGYDPITGRLLSLSNAQGSVVVLAWDAAHIVGAEGKRAADPKPTRLATYRYDADRLIEFEDAYGAMIRYAHDPEGRIVARADRTGYKFGFRYDVDGRCVHSAAEDGVLEVKLEYFPLERRTKVTKSDGGVWEYFYDDVSTLITIIDGEGGTRTFVPRLSDGQIETETDGAGNEYTHEYNRDGRFLQKRDALGRVVREDTDHPVPSDAAEYEFGRLGVLPEELPARTSRVSSLTPLAVSTLTFAAAPGAGRTHRITDIQGLLIREECDGRSRRYAYDAGGNVRWESDLDGARTDYQVASFFQLRAERDANGSTTAMEYDRENKLSAVVDPGGTRTVYLRDKRSELKAIARAGAWKERYERDGAGRLVGKESAAGPLYTVSRGAQGEVLERKLQSGGFEKFEYDEQLRVIRGETAAGESSFAYDVAGNRTVDMFDGLGVRRRFVVEDLVEVAVLQRFVTRYRHVEADGIRFLHITDPTGRRHRLQFLGDGLVKREHDGGRSETTQHHPNGACLHRVLEGGAAPSWVRSFEYNAEGYLLARHDSLRGTTRYQHDAAQRVIAEMPPNAPVRRIVHDAAGNIVRMGARESTYMPGNVLASADGAKYTHDFHQAINSETAACRHRRFQRDERGQLVAVTSSSRPNESVEQWQTDAPWSAAYDVLNRRVSKTSAAGTTRFVWDTDRLAAEIAPDGTARVYVYADAFALTPLLFVDYASVDAAPESGTPYLVFADQLACPERVERLDGTTVWSATFSAYGEASVEVGADFHQPLRWPGHYFDAELGLHYNRFRTYAPTLGRYLEPDPLGRASGLENVYAYTWNPLRQVDVDGLECPLAAGRKREERRQKKIRKGEASPEEEGFTRTESKPTKRDKFSNGDPMPAGTAKVTYRDKAGNKVTCFVDSKGRVIQVKATLKPPGKSRKKDDISGIKPDGRKSGRDDRGHLAPEAGAPNQQLVNQPENVIAEHGKKSNQSAKRDWERNAIDTASKNKSGKYTTVHEPKYTGNSKRPSSVDHTLMNNGKKVGDTETIPNPTR